MCDAEFCKLYISAIKLQCLHYQTRLSVDSQSDNDDNDNDNGDSNGNNSKNVRRRKARI